MEALNVISSAADINSSHLQRIRDVIKQLDTYRTVWSSGILPHKRLEAVVDAIKEDSERHALIKQNSKAASGKSDVGGQGLELVANRFNDSTQWSSLMVGHRSAPFTSMVAAINEVLTDPDPSGVLVVERCYRGAERSSPVHPMQVYMSAPLKSAPPAVHVVFMDVIPFKQYRELFFVLSVAFPDGEPNDDTRIKIHRFSPGFLNAFLKGESEADIFDICFESECVEAVKLALEVPARKPKLKRLLTLDDYSVGPPFLSRLMVARGLRGTSSQHRLHAITLWCEAFIRPALEGAGRDLMDRLSAAKEIFECGVREMFEHCIIIRSLGPLDTPELLHQIPPNATIWQMMRAATSGIEMGTQLRAHNPALARAVDLTLRSYYDSSQTHGAREDKQPR